MEATRNEKLNESDSYHEFFVFVRVSYQKEKKETKTLLV